MHLADGARLRAHDDAGCPYLAMVVADATQQLAVGDVGGAEEDSVASNEVGCGEDPGEVVLGSLDPLAFEVRTGVQSRLDAPPMQVRAEAAMMPSGVPPTPMRRSTPVSALPVMIAPAMSPSEMIR